MIFILGYCSLSNYAISAAPGIVGVVAVRPTTFGLDSMVLFTASWADKLYAKASTKLTL